MKDALKSSAHNSKPALPISSISSSTLSPSQARYLFGPQRKRTVPTILPTSSDSDPSNIGGDNRSRTFPTSSSNCPPSFTQSTSNHTHPDHTLSNYLSSQPEANGTAHSGFLDLTILDENSDLEILDLTQSDVVRDSDDEVMIDTNETEEDSKCGCDSSESSFAESDGGEENAPLPRGKSSTSTASPQPAPETPGYDELKSREDYFRATGWLHHLSHPLPAARKRISADAEEGKAAALRGGREDDEEFGMAFRGALTPLTYEGNGVAHGMSLAWFDRMKLAKEGRQAQIRLEQERDERRQQQQSGKGKGKCLPPLPEVPPLPADLASRTLSKDWHSRVDYNAQELFDHDFGAARLLSDPEIAPVFAAACADLNAGRAPPLRLLPPHIMAQCVKPDGYLFHKTDANDISRYGDNGECSESVRTAQKVLRNEGIQLGAFDAANQCAGGAIRNRFRHANNQEPLTAVSASASILQAERFELSCLFEELDQVYKIRLSIIIATGIAPQYILTTTSNQKSAQKAWHMVVSPFGYPFRVLRGHHGRCFSTVSADVSACLHLEEAANLAEVAASQAATPLASPSAQPPRPAERRQTSLNPSQSTHTPATTVLTTASSIFQFEAKLRTATGRQNILKVKTLHRRLSVSVTSSPERIITAVSKRLSSRNLALPGCGVPWSKTERKRSQASLSAASTKGAKTEWLKVHGAADRKPPCFVCGRIESKNWVWDREEPTRRRCDSCYGYWRRHDGEERTPGRYCWEPRH